MKMLALLTTLAAAGLASAQCPAGAGGCQSITVTIRQAPPPITYLPAAAPAPVQAWSVPSARGVQWYVPTTYVPAAPTPAFFYAAPAGDCAAAGPAVEYRYGPLGRLRRVVVR